VPAIEPAVETAKSRPAIRPTLETALATSRTAIGVTPASTTLGGPKRTIEATSGFSRGPGSQDTIQRSTGSSANGIASTSAPPSSTVAASSAGDGRRSASAPPAQ